MLRIGCGPGEVGPYDYAIRSRDESNRLTPSRWCRPQCAMRPCVRARGFGAHPATANHLKMSPTRAADPYVARSGANLAAFGKAGGAQHDLESHALRYELLIVKEPYVVDSGDMNPANSDKAGPQPVPDSYVPKSVNADATPPPTTGAHDDPEPEPYWLRKRPTVSGPNTDQKPYLHRWQYVLAFVGVVIAAVVALAVGFAAKSNAPEPPSQPQGPDSGVPSVVAQEPSSREYKESSVTGGWGPPRNTYTNASPSPVADLNSITDATWGDTRQFVQCKVEGRPAESTGTHIVVQDPAVVNVTVWIENSSTVLGQDVTDARMRLALPEGPVDDPGINVVLSGHGTAIKEVWSGCKFFSREKLAVYLIPGSGAGELSRGGHGVYEKDVPMSDLILRGKELLPGVDGLEPGRIPANPSVYGIVRFSLLVQPAD